MESSSENEHTSRAIKPDDDHHGNGSNPLHHKPSKAELLASAKVVADAARHRGENKVDKAEVSGAAANLLHAASEYGKLEDKPLGKIVAKAENHLRQYHTSHSTATATTTHSSHSTTNTTSAQTNHPGKDHHGHSSLNSGGDQEGHSGGRSKYGDYIKLAEELAEGVLKKHSGGGSNTSETSTGEQGHCGSGNGYGQYVKMAGDFLKKH